MEPEPAQLCKLPILQEFGSSVWIQLRRSPFVRVLPFFAQFELLVPDGMQVWVQLMAIAMTITVANAASPLAVG